MTNKSDDIGAGTWLADEVRTKLVRSFYKRRFLILLIAQVLLIVVAPLLQGLTIGRTILHVLTSGVLLAAILAVSQSRKLVVIAVLLAGPALIVTWLQQFIQTPVLSAVGYTIEFVFFLYTTVRIVGEVFRRGTVTVDRLFGAICVYLLIGVTWSMLYGLIETAQPGSFRFNASTESLPGQDRDAHLTPNLMYYSFVTISTLGYGDIVPVSRAAQTMSWLEAIVGQLFLALLVARMVGLYIVEETRQHPKGNAE